MTSDMDDRGYARLPEELLAELLADAPAIAQHVRTLLGPALRQRAELRRAAEDAGLIARITSGKTVSSCAVDGGFAVERTIAVDIVLAVAVGIEGFAPPGELLVWDANQYRSYSTVLTHDMDNERLARATMTSMELFVLDSAPHAFHIFDGSHITPVIQLNSGFSSRSEAVVRESAKVARERLLPQTLLSFATDPQIVAMPKYDSSTVLCSLLESKSGMVVSGGDRYVAGLILQGGEYTVPSPVQGALWSELHLRASSAASSEDSDFVDLCEAQLEALQHHELYALYFRPEEASPAYRVEVKPDLATDEQALNDLFQTLTTQMTGPFLVEPYPQYLADVMAKSVSYGLSALQTAAQLALSHDDPELARLVVHSYRTEGK